MISWPRLIQEIKVKPFLDEEPNENVVESWDELLALPWIQQMDLKNLFIPEDSKYVIGTKQSGHKRFVARLWPPDKRTNKMSQLKFQRLGPSAKLPTKSHDSDAGMDLYAAEINESNDHHIWYDTQIAVEIPEGYVGLIFPRSSISKLPLTLANSVGVIDSGYRGGIEVRFNKLHLNFPPYQVGDRIAQLIVMPYPEFHPIWADELSDSERGTSGYGSSRR